MTKSAHMIPPLTILAATVMLATPALAQQARPGEQLGMRYLSWSGKPAGPSNDGLRRPADLAPHAQTASLGSAPTARLAARPNRYGAPMPGASVPSANGPTPASAWIGTPSARSLTQAQPQPQPMPQPMPEAPPQQAQQSAPQNDRSSMPAPARAPAVAAPSDGQMTASAPAYNPSRSLRRQDPYYGAPPEVQTAMQPTPQPVPMPPPTPVPTAVEPTPADPAPADPMAPRRDAMIFRMNRPDASPQAGQQPMQAAQEAPRQLAQAAPTRPGGPPRDSARYYSVHREAGHEPDPMVLPESVFIGGGTADLAEPPPVLSMPRTVNGRTQVVVPNQDPTLP